MNNGKKKCEILKQIRHEIAKANDIEFVTSQCTHKGECLGTCPKCEEEVRYLEQELNRKKKSGARIAIAGIMGSIVAALPGCGTRSANGGDVPATNFQPNQVTTVVDEKKCPSPNASASDSTEELLLMGEVPIEQPDSVLSINMQDANP